MSLPALLHHLLFPPHSFSIRARHPTAMKSADQMQASIENSSPGSTTPRVRCCMEILVTQTPFPGHRTFLKGTTTLPVNALARCTKDLVQNLDNRKIIMESNHAKYWTRCVLHGYLEILRRRITSLPCLPKPPGSQPRYSQPNARDLSCTLGFQHLDFYKQLP